MGSVFQNIAITKFCNYIATLVSVCVSSATGEGMQEVVELIGKCVEEYKTEYVPMYEKVLEDKKKLDEEIKKQRMEEVIRISLYRQSGFIALPT